MYRSTRTLLTLTGLTLLCAALTPTQTRAFPPFKDKEGKPCSYCHVNANGGKRNYRGEYYDKHGKTFAEFDDVEEAKKAGVDVGPDPDPNVKPKSWTAPKTAAAPAEEKPAENGEMGGEKKMTVAEAKAKVAKAAAAYKAKPKDAATKKAYAAATADLAHATMLDESLPPRQRYPQALKLCRDALKLDPTNKTALADKKSIEDAYKSMGRPIPR